MELLGSPGRTLGSIVIFMLVVIVVATMAFMAAGWSFSDASYMVLLTIYTVGYGEVHPINTPYLHAVTVSTIVLGLDGRGGAGQFADYSQWEQWLEERQSLSKAAAKMADREAADAGAATRREGTAPGAAATACTAALFVNTKGPV